MTRDRSRILPHKINIETVTLEEVHVTSEVRELTLATKVVTDQKISGLDSLNNFQQKITVPDEHMKMIIKERKLSSFLKAIQVALTGVLNSLLKYQNWLCRKHHKYINQTSKCVRYHDYSNDQSSQQSSTSACCCRTVIPVITRGS